MNKVEVNDTAAEIAAAREILDAGGIPSDTYWYKAITAEEFGHEGHVEMAGNWTTCACGERDSRVLWTCGDYHDDVPNPSDLHLRRLGYIFGDNCNPEMSMFGRINAAHTLIAIEARVQELEGVEG